MLKTTINIPIIELIFIVENGIINEINNNKVNKSRFGIETDQSKSKTW